MDSQGIALGNFLIAFIDLYTFLIVGRCILSWFPAINWYHQPWLAIKSATDPAMAPFRNLLPAFGGLDFSPILLFVVLSLLKKGIQMAFGLGGVTGF